MFEGYWQLVKIIFLMRLVDCLKAAGVIAITVIAAWGLYLAFSLIH